MAKTNKRTGQNTPTRTTQAVRLENGSDASSHQTMIDNTAAGRKAAGTEDGQWQTVKKNQKKVNPIEDEAHAPSTIVDNLNPKEEEASTSTVSLDKESTVLEGFMDDQVLGYRTEESWDAADQQERLKRKNLKPDSTATPESMGLETLKKKLDDAKVPTTAPEAEQNDALAMTEDGEDDTVNRNATPAWRAAQARRKGKPASEAASFDQEQILTSLGFHPSDPTSNLNEGTTDGNLNANADAQVDENADAQAEIFRERLRLSDQKAHEKGDSGEAKLPATLNIGTPIPMPTTPQAKQEATPIIGNRHPVAHNATGITATPLVSGSIRSHHDQPDPNPAAGWNRITTPLTNAWNFLHAKSPEATSVVVSSVKRGADSIKEFLDKPNESGNHSPVVYRTEQVAVSPVSVPTALDENIPICIAPTTW